ncbi:MAG: hypothetical protein ACFFBL_10425 [Promethearchaeota archaeon]
MEKRSRLTYAVMIMSILLPYGVIEGPTVIGTTVQQWLFPFWVIAHSYASWYGDYWGVYVILPVPWPWYEFPLVMLNLMWFVLGLSTGNLLHELYMGQIQRRFFILLLLGALASQIIMTYLMLQHVYIYTLEYVNPWPVHTLLVFSLTVLYKKRVQVFTS